jgi:SAM-dependent methyltransferase
MMWRLIKEEGIKVFKRPSRVMQAVRPGKIRSWLKALRIKNRANDSWQSVHGEFQRKQYSSYDAYVAHQSLKLEEYGIDKPYEEKLKEELVSRFRGASFTSRAPNVLCLGARNGAEVRAFLELGCFSVGIDLNPGSGNRYVLTGDYHKLQFPDACVDVMYNNTLDHILYPETFLSEISRVLKPGGHIIIDAVLGIEEGGSERVGEYESFVWKNTDNIVEMFGNSNLSLVSKHSIDFPWQGHELVFKKG